MLWLSRPPMIAPLAAAALVGAVLWTTLAPSPTVEHPFAVADHTPGDPLEFRLREVPAGLLPPVSVGEDDRAGRSIGAGEPLLPSDLATATAVPVGWWTVSVDLPAGAAIGDRALLVVAGAGSQVAPPIAVEGRVTALGTDDPFGAAAPGTVAVPPDHAAAVADAALAGRLVVLTGR